MIIIDGQTETKYYYHFDGLGSVAAISDDGGQMTERYSYDVFGEPNRVSDVNNPYLFTGRRFDSETANYYYRARYYKPTIGRFLQTDPIGYGAGFNLYTYVLNNPVIFSDPMGLFIGGGGGYPIIGVPPGGKRCCKEWSEPIWKLLGYSGAARCANAVVSDAWDPIGGVGTGVGVGLIGIVVEPISVGVGIGMGIQWSIAYAVCTEQMCTQHGKTDGCGNCR